MNYDQASQQAQQQGQQAQQQLNQQSAGAQQQYQQQLGSTQAAQKQLQDYTQSIQGGGQQAQDYLNQQYQKLGIDPQAIQSANQRIAQTQTALQNANQSAQQAGGGYGMTAGGQAQALANMQGNLGSVLNAQTNQANALSAQMNQALSNAQMIEQSQLASQDQKMTGYTNAANLAAQVLNTSSQTMNNIQALAQKQGTVTADMVNAYQQAKANAAAASQAYAQSKLIEQQYAANARQEVYNKQLQARLGSNYYVDNAGNIVDLTKTPAGTQPTTSQQTQQAPAHTFEDMQKAWAASPLQTRILSYPALFTQGIGNILGNIGGEVGNWIQGK